MQKLKKCGKDTYDKMKKLSQEFTELSKKNLALEEKITLLYENLDRQREAMLDYDVETYRKSCVEQYKKIWNELEENSREFLITATYLYERSLSQDTDFSPVIIEFCRVFENELLEKIFVEFIEHQADLNRLITYQNRIFSKIGNAVNSKLNNNTFFLSSMDMLKLLSFMGNKYNSNCCEKELQKHIRNKGFDTSKISNRSKFIEPAKNYVNNYRNKAAHPQYMKEMKAEECKEKTKSLVTKFLDAKGSA